MERDRMLKGEKERSERKKRYGERWRRKESGLGGDRELRGDSWRDRVRMKSWSNDVENASFEAFHTGMSQGSLDEEGFVKC